MMAFCLRMSALVFAVILALIHNTVIAVQLRASSSLDLLQQQIYLPRLDVVCMVIP